MPSAFTRLFLELWPTTNVNWSYYCKKGGGAGLRAKQIKTEAPSWHTCQLSDSTQVVV